ncbi:hypothetical protein FHS83_003741 [Rhizomicrobium palustre]|uniref:Uncharacterized protein n=1 Tax=Rhizomicrobium palustre TaxID=189966 RepID=A0A846N469_9PROT|nr:hypothetical protein [Rhizomicrobium palustre]NIK90423.1 hypothetical protein [Rhizomicrobium palustre]
MKILYGLAALLVSVPAFAAEKAACIDPGSSYIAKPLNNIQVYVESSIGPKKPPVRLTTSCHHLQSADGFGLSAEFHCISQGDMVIATIGSDRQSCRVTKIEPYAPQKDDLPLKK